MIKQAVKRVQGGLLLLALLLLVVPSARADLKAAVAEDLAVKSATLVAPVGAEWLIDSDATRGIGVGDLFSVVAKGEPIIHPVTREVLGTLESVKGVLRVTRLKSGYSYAEVLQADAKLQPGQELKRFAGLPATFWDYTSQGEAVFAELRAALPHLEWQDYARTQQTRPEAPRPLPEMSPGLVFVLNEHGLGVKDHQFQPLRFYRAAALGQVPLAAPAPAPAVAVPGATAPTGVAAPSAPGIVAAPQAAAAVPGKGAGLLSGGETQTQRGGLIVSPMENREGIWYGPRVEGHPVGVEVGDLNGDGANEVAMLFTNRLVVANVVNGQYQTLASLELDRAVKALALDGIDLDRDGRMELYLTAVRERQTSSLLVELRDGRLITVKEHIPWMLRRVTLPDEGPVLLGHVSNPESTSDMTDFDGPVFRVNRIGSELQKGAALNVPQNISLYGFVPYVQDGRSLLTNLGLSDKLQLLEPNGAVLWQSHDHFGGSETSITRSDGTRDGIRYVFLKARLEPGPHGTILAPVNEGNRVSSAFRQFRSSHLRALEYDGYSMVERWRTKPQGGYLADYRLADADNDGVDEIVMLVMYSQGSWLKSKYGESVLLIYEMQ